MKSPEDTSPPEGLLLGQSVGGEGRTPPTLRSEAWLPVLQDALAQQGHFTFPLRGDSMRPTLPALCEIEVFPLTDAPRLGQLIVFVTNDTLVAHRLVRRSGQSLIAQGDNRLGPDRLLKPEQLVGWVAGAYVAGSRVWPRRGEALWIKVWLARHHVLRVARWIRRQVLR